MMKKRISVGVYILFLAVIFSLGICLEIRDIRILHEKYKSLEYEDEFAGELLTIKKRKGVSFIEVDSIRLMIPSSVNYVYKNESLVDNLAVGDSISKKAFNDTINLFKDNEHYYFLRGKSINWEKR